jgi:hypothetical protein
MDNETYLQWYEGTPVHKGGTARDAWNHQRSKYNSRIEVLETKIKDLERTIFNHTMEALMEKKK